MYTRFLFLIAIHYILTHKSYFNDVNKKMTDFARRIMIYCFAEWTTWSRMQWWEACCYFSFGRDESFENDSKQSSVIDIK